MNEINKMVARGEPSVFEHIECFCWADVLNYTLEYCSHYEEEE